MECNDNIRYDLITRLLHWVVAVLLIGLVCLGWYMMSIEDQPDSRWYFNLHKSFGIVAGILILIRLVWRLTHKLAPLPSSIPRWQSVSARAVHVLLYFCMLIMPITGFIGASLGKHGILFFGVKLPAWLNPNHDISEQLFDVHSTVVWILVGLVTLHVLAALKHLFINRDGVFQRMWF